MLAKLATSLIKLLGATDSTPIGNIGDRLKVSTLNSITNKFRVVFASPAQVITGSSYVSIYNRSGSGLFYGNIIDSNQDGFQLRILIDGTEVILTDISVSQLNSAGFLASTAFTGYLVRLSAGVIAFLPPAPIPYNSSIQILGKRDNAGNVTIDNYVVYLSQET